MNAQFPAHPSFKAFTESRVNAILPLNVFVAHERKALHNVEYGDLEVIEQFPSLNVANQIANQAKAYIRALRKEFVKQINVVVFWSTRSDDENGEFPFADELADAERHLKAIAVAKETAIKQIEAAELWSLKNDHWAHVLAFFDEEAKYNTPREKFYSY